MGKWHHGCWRLLLGCGGTIARVANQRNRGDGRGSPTVAKMMRRDDIAPRHSQDRDRVPLFGGGARPLRRRSRHPRVALLVVVVLLFPIGMNLRFFSRSRRTILSSGQCMTSCASGKGGSSGKSSFSGKGSSSGMGSSSGKGSSSSKGGSYSGCGS